MRKNPGFAAVIILCLALGIGANTAMFSVVNAVLLRPLPYPDPGRLAMIWERTGAELRRVSPANFVDWGKQSHTVESLGFWPAWEGSREFNVILPNGTERVSGAYASSTLFKVLGIPPLFGRTFTAAEDRPDGSRVAVLSYGLWQSRFGGDRGVLGKPIVVDSFGRRSFEIIGVMPPGFSFPDEARLWLPAGSMGVGMDRRAAPWLCVLARLKPAMLAERAEVELAQIQRAIAERHPESRVSTSVKVVPLLDQAVGSAKPTLLILLGTVGFVLLIACANVANLLLFRGTARKRELAIRCALGAGRRHIVRQLMTESLFYAVLAGLAGTTLAVWGIDLVRRLGPGDLTRLAETSIDARVLGFTLAVSLLTGAIFGAAPAWQLSGCTPVESLREGRTATATPPQAGFRDLLVIAETALAFVLLIGAGLMLRSLLRLEQVDPGFRPEQVVTARLDLSGSRFSSSVQPGANRPQVFTRRVMDRLRALPGVESVAAAYRLPPAPGSLPMTVAAEGRTYASRTDLPVAQFRAVTPGYFKAMRIRLERGRDFTDFDTQAVPGVAILSETAARRLFPGQDAIGKRIDIAPAERAERDGRPSAPNWHQVIGIAGDVKNTGLKAAAAAEIYKPDLQWAWHWAWLVVRANSDPAALASVLPREIRALGPEQPVSDVRLYSAILGGEFAQARFRAFLLGLFGALALVLAVVGIYGVLSYSVGQRTHEIGVRMALGAARAGIVRLVVWRGARLVIAGLAAGTVAAAALSRVLSTVLFEIDPLDPATYVAMGAVLGGVALAAICFPARRAAKLDPMAALRQE